MTYQRQCGIDLRSIGNQLDNQPLMFTGVERASLILKPHGDGALVEYSHGDSELRMSARIHLDRDDVMALISWLDTNFLYRNVKRNDLDELDDILGGDDDAEGQGTEEGALDGPGEGPETDRFR